MSVYVFPGESYTFTNVCDVYMLETGDAYAPGVHTALVLCRNRSLVSVFSVL